jgi:hypothetical protein
MSIDLSNYVDVAERIRIFRERHPEGSLQPANIQEPFTIQTIGDRTFIVYVACAYRTPDDTRPGVGCAWEPFPGQTQFVRNSELMNAETGAWGRAIVAALAADTQKIATKQDVQNRQAENTGEPVNKPFFEQGQQPSAKGLSKAQKTYVLKIANTIGERHQMSAEQIVVNLCGVSLDDLVATAGQQLIQDLTRGLNNPDSVTVDEQTGRVSIA